MKNTNFPEEIKEQFLQILEQEREFVGEKPLDNGFIIKRNKDKATITLDDGVKIYAAKMVRVNNEWRVIGFPSIWENIRELLNIN